MAALADKSSKPESCPHQMAPLIEARVVELRRAHPRWGPRSIRTQLAKEGFAPVPGRSSIYRTLVRHHLLEPTQRKRARSDYKRWERSRSMELWQMDIVGRFHLSDGTEVKVVTGVDDHSRFCVCARVVARATARPVCEALQWALRTHGVPDQILTDNGKVFTAASAKGPDRCSSTGSAPTTASAICSPLRIHRRRRARSSASTRPSARTSWSTTTGCTPLSRSSRPPSTNGSPSTTPSVRTSRWAIDHPSSASPWRRRTGRPISRCQRSPTRFRSRSVRRESTAGSTSAGSIGLGGFRYRVGATFAGESVEVVVRSGLVEILHAGVLVATHAERRRADKGSKPQRAQRRDAPDRRPQA